MNRPMKTMMTMAQAVVKPVIFVIIVIIVVICQRIVNRL